MLALGHIAGQQHKTQGIGLLGQQLARQRQFKAAPPAWRGNPNLPAIRHALCGGLGNGLMYGAGSLWLQHLVHGLAQQRMHWRRQQADIAGVDVAVAPVLVHFKQRVGNRPDGGFQLAE